MDRIEKIIRVAKIIKKETSKYLGEHKSPKEITYSQHLVIQVVFELKEATPAKIADYLKKDRSTIAEVVRRLIKKEILIKRTNPKDKRSYLVTLSDRANEKTKDINKAKEEVLKKIFKDLDEKEVEVFEGVLDKIILGGLDEKY